jgi:hypothetical protein
VVHYRPADGSVPARPWLRLTFAGENNPRDNTAIAGHACTKLPCRMVFLQHFRGGMDRWDPAATDGLAANRPVVLFDNTGVASSSGQTPDTG